LTRSIGQPAISLGAMLSDDSEHLPEPEAEQGDQPDPRDDHLATRWERTT
jgi:hypothetical protein